MNNPDFLISCSPLIEIELETIVLVCSCDSLFPFRRFECFKSDFCFFHSSCLFFKKVLHLTVFSTTLVTFERKVALSGISHITSSLKVCSTKCFNIYCTTNSIFGRDCCIQSRITKFVSASTN